MQENRFVHRVPVSSPTLYPAYTTNIYIVESHGEALIIDAGYDNPQAAETVLETLQNVGSPQVQGIVITHHHRDHCAGASYLASRLACPILCHPLDAAQIQQQIHPMAANATLQDGHMLHVGELTLRVLHAPGHTRGMLNLWLEQERILFTGDNVVAVGTTWIGPPDGSMIDYLATLQRLLELNPAQIAPGHGDMISNPTEKIQFFIERRHEREQQILGLVREQARTVDELVSIVYQNHVHPSVLWVAERTIQGHLEKLLVENAIHEKNGLYSG